MTKEAASKSNQLQKGYKMAIFGVGVITVEKADGTKIIISIDKILYITKSSDGKTHIKLQNGNNTEFTAFSDVSIDVLRQQIQEEQARTFREFIAEYFDQLPGMGGGGN